jgi:hypothetical protein
MISKPCLRNDFGLLRATIRLEKEEGGRPPEQMLF